VKGAAFQSCAGIQRSVSILSGGAKDNGTAREAFGQALRKELMDPFEFARIGNGLNLEAQVITFDTPFEEFELSASFLMEKIQDLFGDILLRSSSETGDCWYLYPLLFRKLPDEATRI
jgi:hypothetical protein